MEGNSIFKRRSIRKFLDKKVEICKLENILRAGMQAPSAHDFRPWEFLITEDAGKLKAISTFSPHSKIAEKAPMGIVVCGNMDNVVKESLWWQQDLSAAIENMLIQAVEEGLGATWLGFYPVDERIAAISELFKLPDSIVPFAVVVLGHSDDKNYFEDRYDGNKVHFEKIIK